MQASWRRLPTRALLRTSTAISDFGLRRDIAWMAYHPGILLSYHRLALADADAVAKALNSEFGRRRAVDVGAGGGAFAAALIRKGWSVVALERSAAGRMIGRTQGVPCRPFDLAHEPAADVSGPFELAYCFEVAEHLPPALGDKLIDFLAGVAPLLVFSAAPPGQGGLGHLNEQPMSYWTERLATHGYDLDDARSEQVRTALEVAGVEAPWLLGNTVVFAQRALSS